MAEVPRTVGLLVVMVAEVSIIAFVRWSRDAGWSDTWYVLSYPIKTWRCRLFGHKWGPEQSDWDPNVHVLMESWQECERANCEGWKETYHYLARSEGDLRTFG